VPLSVHRAEAAGSEQRGGSEWRDGLKRKRRGSFVQRGRRTTCPSTPRRWAVGVAANSPSDKSPTQTRKHSALLAACAVPSAPLLVTAFLLYVRPLLCQLVLVTLPQSPLFHHTPRLDSTLDCVTVFIFAEPYIIDCRTVISCYVTFLILSKLLHSTYRVVDSKFRGLVG